MNKILMLGAAALAFSPLAAWAKEKPPVFVEAKHVKDGKAVTLDSAKAYVLLRTPNAMPIHFVRIATPDEQSSYDKLKADAFAESLEDYAKKLARYERELATSKKTSGMKPPKKPVEPTEANFQFPSFGQMANFTMGAFNRFHSKDGSTYLHAVTPGTYRIYGQVDPLLGMGVCYCMGSVSFEAPAGKIVDLGSLDIDPNNMDPAEKGDSSSPRVFAYALALTPANDKMAVDPRLVSLPRINADLRAAGKVANYMGIGLSRLPAIKGVLSYSRDRIVDEKSVNMAATAP